MIRRLSFSFLLILVIAGLLSAQRTVSGSGVFWAPITINNITAWYASDGRQEASNSALKISGAVFPRKTANAVNTAGILFTADLKDSGSIRTIANGGFYSPTLRQGAILGTRTGIAQNPFDPGVRLWRIRKDYITADLRRDAAETYGIAEQSVSIMDMQRLRNEYRKDWKEWPAALGAPYDDRNHNGIYDPKFILNEYGVEVPDTTGDLPGVAGADQVIWYVCNDLAENSPWNSAPVGLEMQFTIWAYNTSGPLANTVFRRCRFLYKGLPSTSFGATLSNMYAAVWSDAELGGGTDNLAGTDPSLGLAYVYNSRLQDVEYLKTGSVPPAVGYDILQGPAVKGSANDSASVNFTYRKGWKNLPVTSLTYFNQYNPEPFTNAAGAVGLVNALKGNEARSATPRIDPITQSSAVFWATGDPLARTGWIDGVFEAPSYREPLVSTGPFTMAVGDTQEIVTAFIAAQAPDRLAAVPLLKFYDRTIQESFNARIAPPPAMPATGATVRALDRTVLLEWEKDTASLNRTEKFSDRGYAFEGYNVYQLPSADAPRSSWLRLATFDLKNEVLQIVHDGVDPQTGRIVPVLAQSGTNSGIVRYLILTKDSLRNGPFINGQTYTFAVSSYAYTSSSTALVRAIESEPQILTAVPHQPDPGTVLPYALKDSLENLGVDIVGKNDGKVGVKILDPYAVTGGTYDFWFGISGASATWTMVRNPAGSQNATLTTKLTPGDVAVPRPNPTPTSSGTATVTLNDARDRLSFIVDVTTPNTVTSIEIGRGPKTQNGPILKTLVLNSSHAEGVWSSLDAIQPLTDTVMRDLAAGFLYVIVRSTKYPNGELRGQLFDGAVPRVSLAIADFATSSRSVFSFTENRFPNEGVSLFVAPAPVGFKSGEQIVPTRSNIVNEANNEGTYSLVGPGTAWGGYNLSESDIEFRFTNDTNWAIVNAPIPAQTKFIRVPFQVYQDSVRVWAVVENAIPTDSVWDVKGNPYKVGKPTFDKIVGVVNRTDAAGNDISYAGVLKNGVFPTSNAIRGRLINGVNHIARNITVVNESGDGKPPAAGTVIRLTPYRSIKYGDIKRITIAPVERTNTAAAKQAVRAVTVFPNPYYGVNRYEPSSAEKFVTFSHLPSKATLRIYSLAGFLVRMLQKDTPDQFFRWDLKNSKGQWIASGIYIVYIDMPGLGSSTVKLAVIMEDQNLNTY